MWELGTHDPDIDIEDFEIVRHVNWPVVRVRQSRDHVECLCIAGIDHCPRGDVCRQVQTVH